MSSQTSPQTNIQKLKKKSKLIFLVLFISIFIGQIDLVAQEVTGKIEGRIVDESGSAIPGVVINMNSPDLQGTRSTQTNTEGYFRLILLPPGFYTLEITHISYRHIQVDSLQVRLSKTTNLGKIELVDKPYELEEIVVKDRRNLIDHNSTVTGGNFTKEEIEPLPLQRNSHYISLLLPQVNTSYFGDEFSYAGSTGLENRYLTDGIEVTNPLYFHWGISMPYNFIKDVEIITGGYEAQYRGSLGSIINVVTQSGGDKLSGQVFGFYTGKRFTLKSDMVQLNGQPEGDFSLYDIGINLGGPIIKEKLWLNAAYNPSFQNEDIFIPGIGNEVDKQIWNQIAGKLSWHASEKVQLICNFSGEFYYDDKVWVSIPSGIETYLNPDPALCQRSWEHYTPSIRGVVTFSDKFFLEGLFSRYELNYSDLPRTEKGNEPVFYDFENGTVSGGFGTNHNETAIRYSSSLRATLFLNNHIIKSGLEYLDNSLTRNSESQGIGRYSDSLFAYSINQQNGSIGNRIPALYVQDSWRIIDNWQLNAGIRWEGQYIIDSDGKVAQKILDQFQPRIGLIFSPNVNNDDKIFASYGRFYQELADVGIVYYYLKGVENIFRMYDHDPRQNPDGGDTLFVVSGQIQEEIPNLKGQYTDEFSLGYERRILNDYKFSVQGVYRKLGEGIEDGYSNERQVFVLGNPGGSPLSEYPNLRRDYMALEVVFQKVSSDPFNFSISYVLSRNYGNYQGLFDSETGSFGANITSSFEYPEMVENGTGLLPYDRTHAFKFYGSYQFTFGLSLGAFFSWMSGTPLNEYGIGPESYGRIFLQPRGAAGRTPSIWDLNFRLTYLLPQISEVDYQARLILDVFHVASKTVAVNYDQLHYLFVDENGNQIYPNPTYGRPTSYQPPMSFRFGFEINF